MHNIKDIYAQYSAMKPTERASVKAGILTFVSTSVVYYLFYPHINWIGFLLVFFFSFAGAYKTFLKDETANASWHVKKNKD